MDEKKSLVMSPHFQAGMVEQSREGLSNPAPVDGVGLEGYEGSHGGILATWARSWPQDWGCQFPGDLFLYQVDSPTLRGDVDPGEANTPMVNWLHLQVGQPTEN